MAERVGRGPLLEARAFRRLRGLPPAAWFGALLVGAVIFAVAVSGIVGTKHNQDSGEVHGPFGGTATLFTVRYEVIKPASDGAVCDLEAQDELHDVVGTLTDHITDLGQKRIVRTVAIPTTGQAVTALVDSCAKSNAS